MCVSKFISGMPPDWLRTMQDVHEGKQEQNQKLTLAKLKSSESERCITEVSVGRRITAVMQ